MVLLVLATGRAPTLSVASATLSPRNYVAKCVYTVYRLAQEPAISTAAMSGVATQPSSSLVLYV